MKLTNDSKPMKQLYTQIATLVQAIQNCENQNPPNIEWSGNHEEEIDRLVKEMMPSGSGIDRGTKFELSESNPEKLVFSLGYHHMNENGYYDGWTEHRAIVTPSLAFGFNLKISGPDRNQIKEYLREVLSLSLGELVKQEIS